MDLIHHSFYWLAFSLFLCYTSYINMDPLKSCLLLVLSMALMMPILSITSYVWYAYFVCMLFLSGIFVIMVYFSSLCSYFHLSHNMGLLALALLFITLTVIYNYNWCLMNLSTFYYSVYFNWMLFIIVVMLIFINVINMLITGKGALRKF